MPVGNRLLLKSEIPIEQIAENPNHPRKISDNDDSITEMAQGLKKYPHIVTPLIVLKKVKDKEYMIIDDARRFRAAKQYGMLQTLLCQVYRDLDEMEIAQIQSSQNFSHRKWNTYDRLSFFEETLRKWLSKNYESYIRYYYSKADMSHYHEIVIPVEKVQETLRDFCDSYGGAIPYKLVLEYYMAITARDPHIKFDYIDRMG